MMQSMVCLYIGVLDIRNLLLLDLVLGLVQLPLSLLLHLPQSLRATLQFLLLIRIQVQPHGLDDTLSTNDRRHRQGDTEFFLEE